jgi:hypothetical protein
MLAQNIAFHAVPSIPVIWKGLKKSPIHHLEDLNTGAKDNPELREEAQQMVDQVREVRRKIDEIRVNELAEEKAKKMLSEKTL